MRQRQVHDHSSAARVRQHRRERTVHSRLLVVRETHVPAREILLVGGHANRTSRSRLRGRRFRRGRDALDGRRALPHAGGFYRTDFALEQVGVGEVPPLDGHRRASPRVARSREHRLGRRRRRILELHVRRVAPKRADAVGHVHGHRLLFVRRGLAPYQRRGDEVRVDARCAHAARRRRLKVVAAHLHHRPGFAVVRKQALHGAGGDVLEPLARGLAVGRLFVQRELHVHPPLLVRRGGTLHHVVAHERSRRQDTIHLTLHLHAGDVTHLREVRSLERELVPAAGRALQRVHPLHLGDLVPDCDESWEAERGAGKVSLRSRDRTNARKKRGRHRRVVGGAGRAGSRSRRTYPWEQTAAATSSASAGWTSREDDASSRARRRRPRAPSRIFEARSKPGRFCVDDPSGRSPAEPRPPGACSDRFRPAHSALEMPRLSALSKRSRSLDATPTLERQPRFSTPTSSAPQSDLRLRSSRARRRRDAGSTKNEPSYASSDPDATPKPRAAPGLIPG